MNATLEMEGTWESSRSKCEDNIYLRKLRSMNSDSLVFYTYYNF